MDHLDYYLIIDHMVLKNCGKMKANKTSIQWTPGSSVYLKNFVSLSILIEQKNSDQNMTKYTMDPGIFFLMKTNI